MRYVYYPPVYKDSYVHYGEGRYNAMAVIWINPKTEKRINDKLRVFWGIPKIDEILKEMPWDHKINNMMNVYDMYLEGTIISPMIQNR